MQNISYFNGAALAIFIVSIICWYAPTMVDLVSDGDPSAILIGLIVTCPTMVATGFRRTFQG